MLKLYPLREVMENWNVSRQYIKGAIAKGDLEATMIGRTYRFTEDQLNDFLIKRTLSKKKKIVFKK